MREKDSFSTKKYPKVLSAEREVIRLEEIPIGICYMIREIYLKLIQKRSKYQGSNKNATLFVQGHGKLCYINNS